MGLPFAMRFDFRNPAFAGTSFADRYQASLDMAAWADRLGCLAVTVSEHHGSPDGYLPSPLPMVAAMAAKTTHVRFAVAALVAPFYDPIRLSEDMVVLDHLSRGRVDLIVAGGYVPDEFEMYGIPLSERGARVTEVVQTLKAAFGGEPFTYRGRTVHITPPPYRSGGPSVVLGGSSEPAARRAARIADGFLPSVPEVWEFYVDELRLLDKADPGPCPVSTTPTVFLSIEPERAWEQVAPFFLHETNAYGAWLEKGDGAGPYRSVGNLDELRATGSYEVLTPEDYVERLHLMAVPFALLHPLCGGLTPELGLVEPRALRAGRAPGFRGVTDVYLPQPCLQQTAGMPLVRFSRRTKFARRRERPERTGCSAVAGAEADGSDEVVDLAVPLAVDDPAGGAFGSTPGGAAQAASAVAVLHRLDVPEVTGQPVKLGPRRAHRATSFCARSARTIRSTMAANSSGSSVSSSSVSSTAMTPTQPMPSSSIASRQAFQAAPSGSSPACSTALISATSSIAPSASTSYSMKSTQPPSLLLPVHATQGRSPLSCSAALGLSCGRRFAPRGRGRSRLRWGRGPPCC